MVRPPPPSQHQDKKEAEKNESVKELERSEANHAEKYQRLLRELKVH
jgi:hypothetical protein